MGPAVTEEGREQRVVSSVFLHNWAYKLHFEPVSQEGITVDDFRFWPQFLEIWRSRFSEPPPVQLWPKRESGKPLPMDFIRADEVWRKLNSDGRGQHSKLGGFPAFPKDDPRTVLPECAGGECPWDTVLFQMISPVRDVERQFQWHSPLRFGEGGWATFLMREEDLLRRDFSRVGYYWQDNSDAAYFKELCGEEWRPSARLAFSPV